MGDALDVREKMIAFLQAEYPQALWRQRQTLIKDRTMSQQHRS